MVKNEEAELQNKTSTPQKPKALGKSTSIDIHKSPSIKGLVANAIVEHRQSEIEPISEPEEEARESDISDANEVLSKAQETHQNA